MKVLRQGNVDKKVQWWVSRSFDCPNCNAALQLEDGDEVKQLPKGVIGRDDSVDVVCPECEYTIELRKHHFTP